MRLLFITLLLLPATLRAEVPKVATDIAPVHALVSQVMKGVGAPSLIIPPAASPHGYAMRPSEARALSGADLVVWVGPELTPWLEAPLDALAGEAHRLALIDVKGMSLLGFREGESFEGHDDHDAHEDHDADEDHDAHDDHDADVDHDAHDDHDADDGHDEHEDHDAHDHEGNDPHIWLDPKNGATALAAIAEVLGDLDPENAMTYQENAQEGQNRLSEVSVEIDRLLAGLKTRPFIVFHDAFHYFEARFGIEAVAAVSTGDAAAPGAGRIAALRAHVAQAGAVCAFGEPQLNNDLLITVTEGQNTKLAMLDPLGSALELGPELYPDLLLAMAGAMADCLRP